MHLKLSFLELSFLGLACYTRVLPSTAEPGLERVCEGFLSHPEIEEIRAVILAHLERQFPQPERRR